MTLIALYILGGAAGGAVATAAAVRLSQRVRDALINPNSGGGPRPKK